MKLRPVLLLSAAVLCIVAGAARAQYVEDSIDVGGGWVGSLAYNSREDALYGASEDGIFFAISCDSNKLIKSLSVNGAFAVEYDSLDNKAYCSYSGHESLLVVDGVVHGRTKSIPMDGATLPVWDQASNRLYVSCQSRNRVAVLDCATDSLLKYVAVGACPMQMYLNASGRRLYVQNYDAGTVSVIDLTTDNVVRTLNVGGNPNAGYYCSGAGKFYSAGDVRQCIVISGQSDTIVARIPLPGNAEVIGAAGSKTGGLVYLGIADGGPSDYVATVSTESDSLRVTAVVDGGPYALACYWSSGLVYCATDMAGRLFLLSSDGAQVLDTLQVGQGPAIFTPVPSHDRLYLGHLGSRYVYVLRDMSAGVADQPRTKLSVALRALPNPFAQNVTLAWNSPPEVGEAIRVCAGDGRLVSEAHISEGQARWVWDGRDDSGAPLPPGVYVIEAGPGIRAKVVKLK
jgi:YVTN family beta-propeller protein